ncbi:MAG: hypothetical protein ABWZ88_19610, partial [Variovorax sp.]
DGLEYATRLRGAGVPVELLHYAGQFHGFLNFDAILGAARDGLERIGETLRDALHGRPTANRTIELTDEPAATERPVRGSVKQAATATLMAWQSLGHWADTLLRLASPPLATAAGMVLLPVLAPVSWATSAVHARLHRMQAQETFTAGRAP